MRAVTGLTPAERERLTFWKWTYSLESRGFTTAEARRIVFLRVLRLAGRIAS